MLTSIQCQVSLENVAPCGSDPKIKCVSSRHIALAEDSMPRRKDIVCGFGFAGQASLEKRKQGSELFRGVILVQKNGGSSWS